LILQTFRKHGVGCTWPVDAGIRECASCRVFDPATISVEWNVWEVSDCDGSEGRNGSQQTEEHLWLKSDWLSELIPCHERPFSPFNPNNNNLLVKRITPASDNLTLPSRDCYEADEHRAWEKIGNFGNPSSRNVPDREQKRVGTHYAGITIGACSFDEHFVGM